MRSYYEFFAGGGMARAGLGPGWKCLFANDFDHRKGATYRLNWGDGELRTQDVALVDAGDLTIPADLIWGSFPCQDLSLAGGGAGLKGDRSGTFWPFWKIVTELRAQERSPKIIALENVIGTLHSHNGKDFASICNELHQAGYKFGAIVVDAVLFVPQSRPRLFIIGIRKDLSWPKNLFRKGPSLLWHSRALLSAYEKLPEDTSQSWVWWEMPPPPRRNVGFSELVEHNPTGVRWHSPAETQRILDLMSGVNLAKIEAAKCASLSSGRQLVGGIYRRTRLDENGFKVQRAEVRFDDVAGCLRTPAGGSSRQLIAVVDGKSVRTRLISSRETARLMGLPDHYILPDNYNEAYHLTGDGVVVPVVRYIAENIFEPLLSDESLIEAEAA